ncbi:MAG: hypothetical protein K9M57_04130 [Phycisphaerae bacterium]|nr:hypothetical protein [Phycisphaerae bacterium]
MYLIGDFSYHFDMNNERELFPTSRLEHTDEHMGEAVKMAKEGSVDAALKQFGIALHPLQDTFSHIPEHNAETPFDHAPFEHCLFKGDPFGILWEDCRKARKNNPNWGNHSRPDKENKWHDDYNNAGTASMARMAELMKYPSIQCACGK